MTWYYEQAGEQRGPVTDPDLENLFRAGTIRPETMIWREGMENWTPYSQAKNVASASAVTAGAGPGKILCAECGKPFSPDEMIKFGDRYVCAVCKPIFVQKLKEGAALTGAMEYAGFLLRFGAKFVDGIILQIGNFAINLTMGMLLRKFDPNMVPLLILPITLTLNAVYSIFFIGKFGATPGKMAAKIRVVNADGSKVSYGKACARFFAEFLSALTLMIGYIMAAFDDEKRALHDRICHTRVIKIPPR